MEFWDSLKKDAYEECDRFQVSYSNGMSADQDFYSKLPGDALRRVPIFPAVTQNENVCLLRHCCL